jgi:hypothetical protein
LIWINAAAISNGEPCERSPQSGCREMPFLRIVAVLLLSLVLLDARPARAEEIEGAWASDDEHCDKIFENRNGRTVLAQDSDMYGGGFVIDNNRITGKMARCTITSRRKDGDTVHLLAACATDIMLSSVQFSLRVRADDQLTRVFPGMEGIEINYRRCRL